MKMNIGGIEEEVVTRSEFPLERARAVLKDETIAIMGYGSQGPGQSLNLKDNGFKVVVGQREGTASYQKALEDGWEPGRNLFPIEEAARRGTIVANLLSDAGQALTWESLEKCLESGNASYFSHGFPIHFSAYTNIVPPSFVDVVMVAPKGAGPSVRSNFLDGSGINSSYAVERDHTKRALDRTLAMGIGIGSGFLFGSTFRNEVVSDHVGERAFLLGELWAIAEAAYETLRNRKHYPNEAFINSSEQITQVILPLIGKGGVAEIYTRAQDAGELGTVLIYQDAVREATKPILEELYRSVTEGKEAQIALVSNSDPRYRQNLTDQLGRIEGSEMWMAGKEVRDKVPDRTYGFKITNWGLAGAIIGAMEAQYQLFIDKGHKPSEAFNETVEEATQSLNPFYQRRGMAHLLSVCSTTAQVGALEWGPKFKRLLVPKFKDLDTSYGTGGIPSLDFSVTKPSMWEVGKVLRNLRPEYQKG